LKDNNAAPDYDLKLLTRGALELNFGKILTAAAMALTASAALTAAAHASTPVVIYDNFGPAYDADCCQGWTVATAAATGGVNYAIAAPFVSSGSYDLTQIDLALSLVAGSGDADIALWTDAGGTLGSLIQSWHVVATTPIDTLPSVVTISGITGVHLQAGGAYYLRASATGDTNDAWNINNTSVFATLLSTVVPTINGPPGAFDVLGTSPAPEPAVWSMMLLGFGTLGVALRARRRAAAAA
jgi:hypothetical protein